MPGFCLHLISFQLLIGWQKLWIFLSSFSIFLEFFNTSPVLMNFRNVFCWFFLCFWPSFQIIFTFPELQDCTKCEDFWSNEMVDKIDVILLPSVSSVYSFFFYCFMIFFFRLDFKKNCSFKSSFVDFFFVKLRVFVYFSLTRGILMIHLICWCS